MSSNDPMEDEVFAEDVSTYSSDVISMPTNQVRSKQNQRMHYMELNIIGSKCSHHFQRLRTNLLKW